MHSYKMILSKEVEKDESPILDIGNEKVQSITRCAAVKNIGQCTNV